jgi:hypothetical protein
MLYRQAVLARDGGRGYALKRKPVMAGLVPAIPIETRRAFLSGITGSRRFAPAR